MAGLRDRVRGIASLADPTRTALYDYVSTQPEAVTREQAAAALDIALHQAKFHLDRLAADGLLETGYARVGGRGGPGAGRPSKLYRRASTEIAVTLPERRYELAGHLLATAIEEAESSGTGVRDCVTAVAARFGTGLADAVPASGPEQALAAAADTLAGLGFEPRIADGRVTLANCPFHHLARDHTALVCGMNLSLIDGLLRGHDGIRARLDPAPDRCCVAIESAEPGDARKPPP